MKIIPTQVYLCENNFLVLLNINYLMHHFHWLLGFQISLPEVLCNVFWKIISIRKKYFNIFLFACIYKSNLLCLFTCVNSKLLTLNSNILIKLYLKTSSFSEITFHCDIYYVVRFEFLFKTVEFFFKIVVARMNQVTEKPKISINEYNCQIKHHHISKALKISLHYKIL